MLNTECPKCGSKETRSCKIVHAAGTSEASSGSIMLAAGGGGERAILAKTESGVHQSLLAELCNPPPLESAFIQQMVYLGISILSGVVAVVSLLIGLLGFGIVAGILSYGFWYGFNKQAEEVSRLQEDHEKWEKTWICLRCGDTYSPTERHAASEAA